MSFDAGAVVARMELSHREMGKAIARVKKDFKGFGQESEKQVVKTRKAWLSLKSAIAGLGLAYAIRQMARFGAEAVKDFGTAERLTEANNIQLEKYGRTWEDVRAAMKKATGGAVSDLELLKRSGQALTLGLKPDEFIEMAGIARAAARAMGEDTSQMLESIITGTARQSKLWLDNLGIIIDTEKAYKDYAAAVGKSVKQLSEQERKQAFTNAVLERGRDMVADLGDESADTAIAIEKATAAFNNMKIAIGKIIASKGILGDTLTFWATQLGKISDALLINDDSFVKASDKMIEAQKKVEDLKNKIAYAEEFYRNASAVKKIFYKDEEKYLENLEAQLVVAEGLANAAKLEWNAVRKRTIKEREIDDDDDDNDDGDGGETEEEKRLRLAREEAAEEEAERLRQQYLTEEQIAQEHYDKTLEILQQGDLEKDELRKAEIQAEQELNDELARIQKERTDKMQAAQEKEIAAKKEKIAAYKQSARVGVQLLINDVAAQSKIMAAFEVAEGTKAFAKFLETKDPTFLLSSLQHALAAKQYLEAAKSGGGGGGGRGGGGGGVGGGRRDTETPGREEPELREQPAAAFEVHFHGGFATEEAVTEWTVNTFAPLIENAVNAGKLELKTKRE